ncbi:MAG TPA: hypothetical protein VK864_04370, partial [Longimicrobiales bacterium]|nr:hypothetical protein [Longimicrobiales bacterium]
MRINSLLRSVLPALSLAVVWSYAGSQRLSAQTAAPPAAPAAAPAPSVNSTWQGTVWPALLVNGLFGGPSDNRTHYLERYAIREGFSSDRRTALFADVADISLAYHDGRRDVFTVERHVWSRDNQRGAARFDTDRVRLSGGYGYLRQAANGLDYLFAPSLVAGGVDPAYTGGTVGYVGKFNDSVADALFATGRTTYDVAFRIKPATFDDKASAGVAFHGIERSGRVFESLNMGGGDVLGT